MRTGNGLKIGARQVNRVAIATLLLLSSSFVRGAVKDLNTAKEFPLISSRQQWTERAQEIRTQILVSCGLWPMPAKTALQPHIFDRVEREGYSVEKVYFETLPGFYLCGNLYRPLGRGRGPFPAILNPHGHWKEGRLADGQDGSIPARCIQFARFGMIAFSYDMVGFNDSFFADQGKLDGGDYYSRHRRFATNQVCQLWNVNLMGLQTWNSIRALDFLESLPDADRKKLGCTGESGGGTQTYMLGAIDDRLSVQAPVVMVSHTMQGGCSCENAPGLRVEYSNMEIAAAAAPRPQMLVAATGDWTKTTLTVEGPAIEHIYELLGAPERLSYVRFNFGHNYNRTSREAVYGWFGRWLLKDSDALKFKESDYRKEPDSILRVWQELPENAKSEQQCVQWFIEGHRKQIAMMLPEDTTDLERFRAKMLPAWRHTLQLEPAQPKMDQEWNSGSNEWRSALLELNRPDESHPLTAIYFSAHTSRENKGRSKLVVLANPEGDSIYCDEFGQPTGLAQRLLRRGCGVLVVKGLSSSATPDQFANFFTTYNRTRAQRAVRDLITVCSAAREISSSKGGRAQVVLWGEGRAGLWSLLASPGGVDAVVADCDQIDPTRDESLMSPDLFCPGIRNIGAFDGVALVAAPHPLLIHNVSNGFPTEKLKGIYGSGGRLRVERTRLDESAVADWILALQ